MEVTPQQRTSFYVSISLMALAFLAVGITKGVVLNRPWIRSGLETLLLDGGAALVAFIVGYWLRQTYGVEM